MIRNKEKWSCCLFLIFSCSIMLPTTSYATTQFIKFQDNDCIVEPTHPFDPNIPIVPSQPVEKGPLCINYVTSFNFGKQEMSHQDATFYAELPTITTLEDQTEKVPNFIQITNNSGGGNPWKLTVAQNEPLTSEKGFEIVGSKITLTNGTPHSVDGLETKPIVSQEIVLDSKEPQVVAKSEEHTGQGSWNILFAESNDGGEKDVALFVPGKAKKEEGTYKTSLTWTIIYGT